MDLLVSRVPRALESRARLFGFELGDLLLVFLYLALSNLLFGQTRLKFPIVWMGTITIAAGFYFLKRGKPESYLQHAGEYFWSAGVLAAGAPDVGYRRYPPVSKQDGTEVCHDQR